MAEILRTKLYIPRKRSNLVPRPLLMERINNGLEKKLTLISAPAGFGKTTLLSEWIPKSPRSVTWLFLDEGDNDPTQFWSYFIAALQGLHPDLGASAFSLIQSPKPPPIKSILTELINELTAHSVPLACVLDDYHFIDSQPIHEALSFLIDHLPANVHLVITTREDPDLPLARLRARNHVTEIRTRDLRFTQKETEAFLRDVMGLDLSRQDMVALENRTEGWVVGLQLAGLSMQRKSDLKAFIADFSGSHRHILDYLTAEVLQQQPEDIRSFLLHTSILDRLSGPLCDALTGRIDGDMLLAHLEAANLFVTPLDEKRHWYRYHRLFSDLLRNELTRSQQDLIPELHRRASRWYERNGDIQSAIDHALQASELPQAARLIEQHALPNLYQGQVTKVVSWCDRLPAEIVEFAPMLCICKAWALVLTQGGARREEVEPILHAANLALDQVNADEALRDLVAGHAASIRAFIQRVPALRNKEPEKVIALSREAQLLLPVEEKAVRSTTSLNIGYGYLALADLEAARLAFNQTLEDGLAGGNYYAAIYGPINLANIAIIQGSLREALQICTTYIDRFNQIQAGKYFPPIGGLYIIKGSILLEFNRLAEAEQALMEGLDLVRWTGEFVAPKKGYTALARLRASQGARQEMLETIKTLDETWPEGTQYAEALRYRLLICYWPEDGEVRKDAFSWLAKSGIVFEEMAVIDGIDPVSNTTFERYLNAAYMLAHLTKELLDSYPLEGVQDYLKRQEDFAASRGFASRVVEIAIARAMLYQAVGKKVEALKILERAIHAAANTDLLFIFLDEGERLQSLLQELKPHLTDQYLIVYTNRLLEAFSYITAKPKIEEGYQELLSERELEVLRYLASGLSYKEIGQQLYLSLNTVQFHVKNIYGKLLVNKRMQAIEKAREMNLI
jgi:LuxR family maltose regulon positive regulatory protein